MRDERERGIGQAHIALQHRLAGFQQVLGYAAVFEHLGHLVVPLDDADEAALDMVGHHGRGQLGADEDMVGARRDA